MTRRANLCIRMHAYRPGVTEAPMKFHSIAAPAVAIADERAILTRAVTVAVTRGEVGTYASSLIIGGHGGVCSLPAGYFGSSRIGWVPPDCANGYLALHVSYRPSPPRRRRPIPVFRIAHPPLFPLALGYSHNTLCIGCSGRQQCTTRSVRLLVYFTPSDGGTNR
jgi:hypothetical protein